MLDNALTTQLKTYLEMVREPIILVPSPYQGGQRHQVVKVGSNGRAPIRDRRLV